MDWWPRGSLSAGGLWEGEGVRHDDVGLIQPAALGDGVTIEAGAQLYGRVVLGAGSTVRAGAQLEDCVVFDEVELGEESQVFNSVVCDGARIGTGTTVERSIVGSRTTVGRRNQLRGTRLWNDVEIGDGVLVVDG